MAARTVTDAEIRRFEPRLEEIAAEFGQRAEQDDLVQEGRISVWTALRSGHFPTDDVIRKAMRAWCRKVYRQRRGIEGSIDDPLFNLPYDSEG